MEFQNQILRLPNALTKLGYKRSTFYKMIALGLMVEPVKLSSRCVGWPSHELDAVIKARTKGITDSNVRELVKQLHSVRSGG
jgi:prophage regulatory protein